MYSRYSISLQSGILWHEERWEFSILNFGTYYIFRSAIQSGVKHHKPRWITSMTVICFFIIEINDVLQQLIMLVIFKKSNIFTIFRKTTVVMNVMRCTCENSVFTEIFSIFSWWIAECNWQYNVISQIFLQSIICRQIGSFI